MLTAAFAEKNLSLKTLTIYFRLLIFLAKTVMHEDESPAQSRCLTQTKENVGYSCPGSLGGSLTAVLYAVVS